MNSEQVLEAAACSLMFSCVSIAGRLQFFEFRNAILQPGFRAGTSENLREFTHSHTLTSSVAQLAALAVQVDE